MFNLFKKKSMNFENINAQQFAEMIEQENHVVLDVRSPEELTEGAVPGHIMINFFEADFKDKITKLDKLKTYLVYCRSGNRSGKACTVMGNMGFEKLYNLQGGITAWNGL